MSFLLAWHSHVFALFLHSWNKKKQEWKAPNDQLLNVLLEWVDVDFFSRSIPKSICWYIACLIFTSHIMIYFCWVLMYSLFHGRKFDPLSVDTFFQTWRCLTHGRYKSKRATVTNYSHKYLACLIACHCCLVISLLLVTMPAFNIYHSYPYKLLVSTYVYNLWLIYFMLC